jgi:thermostable 8-oxoguanine DNA glycosylase
MAVDVIIDPHIVPELIMMQWAEILDRRPVRPVKKPVHQNNDCRSLHSCFGIQLGSLLLMCWQEETEHSLFSFKY